MQASATVAGGFAMTLFTTTPRTPSDQTTGRGKRERLPLPRWFPTLHKHVTNHLVLRSAGRRDSRYAIVRHVGRRSGKLYATPVVPYPLDDGFLIALPYGPRVDWLRNLEAAGQATIQLGDVTYTVGYPEVLTEECALSLLSAPDALRLRRLHVPRYLHVRVLGEED
jgi:deazaflavin-dependent oxidoreductase (nitroreductase family)